jgi:hypothetical protein
VTEVRKALRGRAGGRSVLLARLEFLGGGKHDLAFYCCYFHSTFFLANSWVLTSVQPKP